MTTQEGRVETANKKVGELVKRFDERVNVKKLTRKLAPYLQFIVRLMLVSSFLDDSFHTATHLHDHTLEVSSQGCFSWLGPSAPIFSTIFLLLGLLSQFLGSFCLLCLKKITSATNALITWVIVQPILYGQLSNFEFVAESLSLVGGLLLLKAHLVKGTGNPYEQENETNERTKLVGRMLLPAMYVFYAGQFLHSSLIEEETSSIATYIASLSTFVFTLGVIAGIIAGSLLVGVGLKSRKIALMLAFLNIGFVFYYHPFFTYISRSDGSWKYSLSMPMPNVALPSGVKFGDFKEEQIYEIHRYYFWLGCSTSGALGLLAIYGPGDLAWQKHEHILPVRNLD